MGEKRRARKHIWEQSARLKNTGDQRVCKSGGGEHPVREQKRLKKKDLNIGAIAQIWKSRKCMPQAIVWGKGDPGATQGNAPSSTHIYWKERRDW